jgi:hypothetical protein
VLVHPVVLVWHFVVPQHEMNLRVESGAANLHILFILLRLGHNHSRLRVIVVKVFSLRSLLRHVLSHDFNLLSVDIEGNVVFFVLRVVTDSIDIKSANLQEMVLLHFFTR